jgi:hypothetical protein
VRIYTGCQLVGHRCELASTIPARISVRPSPRQWRLMAMDSRNSADSDLQRDHENKFRVLEAFK